MVNILMHFWGLQIMVCHPGQHSWYRNLLRAGWFRVWILVEVKFSMLVLTCPEAHPASCTMCTRSFLGIKCPLCDDDLSF